jgi:hypothetical protein
MELQRSNGHRLGVLRERSGHILFFSLAGPWESILFFSNLFFPLRVILVSTIIEGGHHPSLGAGQLGEEHHPALCIFGHLSPGSFGRHGTAPARRTTGAALVVLPAHPLFFLLTMSCFQGWICTYTTPRTLLTGHGAREYHEAFLPTTHAMQPKRQCWRSLGRTAVTGGEARRT